MNCFENQIKAMNPLNTQENCSYAHIQKKKNFSHFPKEFIKPWQYLSERTPLRKRRGEWHKQCQFKGFEEYGKKKNSTYYVPPRFIFLILFLY